MDLNRKSVGWYTRISTIFADLWAILASGERSQGKAIRPILTRPDLNRGEFLLSHKSWEINECSSEVRHITRIWSYPWWSIVNSWHFCTNLHRFQYFAWDKCSEIIVFQTMAWIWKFKGATFFIHVSVSVRWRVSDTYCLNCQWLFWEKNMDVPSWARESWDGLDILLKYT
jgi:hypothetical protein